MSFAAESWLQILEQSQSDPAGDSPANRYFRGGYDFPVQAQRVLRRYQTLTERYRDRFQIPDVAIARAPGRVNLIGEHTDYNGLPVFPMAVDRDIAAVFAPRSDRKVVIANTDPRFTERSFDIEESIPPYSTGDWGNYCKAAVQGLLDYYRQKHRQADGFRGFQAVLDGDIPLPCPVMSPWSWPTARSRPPRPQRPWTSTTAAQSSAAWPPGC